MLPAYVLEGTQPTEQAYQRSLGSGSDEIEHGAQPVKVVDGVKLCDRYTRRATLPSRQGRHLPMSPGIFRRVPRLAKIRRASAHVEAVESYAD